MDAHGVCGDSMAPPGESGHPYAGGGGAITRPELPEDGQRLPNRGGRGIRPRRSAVDRAGSSRALKNLGGPRTAFSGNYAAGKARLWGICLYSAKIGQSSSYLAQENGGPVVHIVGRSRRTIAESRQISAGLGSIAARKARLEETSQNSQKFGQSSSDLAQEGGGALPSRQATDRAGTSRTPRYRTRVATRAIVRHTSAFAIS